MTASCIRAPWDREPTLALFNPDDAEIGDVTYVRVKRVAYFSEALNEYDKPYDQGPYDSALSEE